MTEWQALLATVAANFADDLPRLVAADWLEDRGRAGVAEFIRVQVALEANRSRVERAGVLALHEREEALAVCGRELAAPLTDVFKKRPGEADVRVRRGFPDRLDVTAAALLSRGPEARRAGPTVRRLRVFRANGFAARLVKSDALRGWPELEFGGWQEPAEFDTLAAGRALPDVHTLCVWIGVRNHADDGRMIGTVLDARAWPNLQTLRVFAPHSGWASVTLTDQFGEFARARGRPVACVIDHVPPLVFPPDFPHFCPGVRPDGLPLVARPNGRGVGVKWFHPNGGVSGDTLPDPAVRAAAAAAREAGPPLSFPAVRAAVLEAVNAAPAVVRARPFRWPDPDADPVPAPLPTGPRGEACPVDPPNGPLPAFGHALGYGGEVARIVEAGGFTCAGRRYDHLGREVR